MPVGTVGGAESWQVEFDIDGRVEDLSGAREAALLSSGGVVVANAGAQRLRFYSPSGAFEGAVGRGGSGPGEFRFLNSLVVTPGDTVLAFDGATLRITAVTRDRRVAGTMSMRRHALGSTSFLVGRLPDGSLLFLGSTAPRPYRRSPGLIVDTASLVRASRLDRHSDVRLGEVPITTQLATGGGPGLFVMRPPFPATVAVGVCGDSALVAFGDSAFLTWRSLVDGSRRRLALHLARPVLHEADVDAAIARLRERAHGDLAKRGVEVVRRYRDELRRPYFDHAALDADGTVWIGSAGAPDSAPSTWRHLNGNGVVIDSLSLPPRARILAMSADRVLVHWMDADDLDRLRVYRRSPPVVDRCSSGTPATVTATPVG